MNKKAIVSWCLFDFANSAYSAVIAAVVFPVFYVNTIVGNEGGQGDLWWGRAISLSMAIVALSSPFLGGIADHAHAKKKFLIAYTLLCVSAVASLSYLERGMAAEGFFLIVLANIGMEGGLVFYNSFLPGIVNPSYIGRVSAWGFGVGYAGSIFSLFAVLGLIESGMISLAWPFTAVFFLIFALPAFFNLPQDRKTDISMLKAALRGVSETWKRLLMLRREKNPVRFLISYILFEDGVNTVIVFSSIYAATTLSYTPKELVLLYLLVQVTALLGAFGMAPVIDRKGPKTVISLTLLLWIAVTFAAYFTEDKRQFMVVASVAGIGLGTIQAASRALFSRFIPPGLESQYFGIYSLVGKSSAVAGPLIFGAVSSALGSQRPAILSVLIFFVAGFIVLRTVRDPGQGTVMKD